MAEPIGLAVSALLLAFLASVVRLARARAPEDEAGAYRLIAACIIGGLIIMAAPYIVAYVTQSGNPIEQAQTIAGNFGPMVENLFTLLKIVGGLFVTYGIVWGGIQLRRKGR